MKQRLGLCGSIFILGAVAAWSSLVWAQPQNGAIAAGVPRFVVVIAGERNNNTGAETVAIRYDSVTGRAWKMGAAPGNQSYQWYDIGEGGAKP